MYADLTAAKILADSTFRTGTRLVTLEATFPRIILAEVNTHKGPSRNSASSRAIPVEKQIQKVMTTPFVPQRFPIERPGMSATDFHEPGSRGYEEAAYFWLSARNAAVNQTNAMIDLAQVHKSIASRLLEPFLWHTAIISATLPVWEALFELRCAPDAQPEFQTLARAMRAAIEASTPSELRFGDWHLPLIGFPSDDDLSLEDKIKVSVGRVARVSYLTHAGTRDTAADIALFDRLKSSGHWSPFEHCATPSYLWAQQANLKGWRQARHFVEVGAPSFIRTPVREPVA